ncbi:aminoglycoside phosphotransferase family protein [Bacillus sp. BGMRC 2118]|nr:aminoglycoside phosphotransferase family protein [Bacillus sp. BGMRC 2118]
MLKRVMQQFGLQVHSLHEVEDSHSSTVYKCMLSTGENVYLKIPYTKLKFQRELEAYELLKGKVPIPEMINYWTGDEEYPGAFVLSELKGTPLPSKASLQLAYQVGVVHAELHEIRPASEKEFTGIKNEYPNWSTFIENQFYSFAEDVMDILDEQLYKKALTTFKEMKEQLPSPDGPSFVHMDFRPANIIVETDKVVGIIDFESVRFGSTESDFTKIYRDFLRFDDRTYKAYKDGYKTIRPLIDLEKVLPFYQFTDAFNSIGWCKRRGIEKNKFFLEENVSRLKTWLL